MSVELGPSGVEMNFDVEVPSEEMKKKFEKWDETHTVDNLTDMSLKDIESERLLFEAEVMRFKIHYRRGKSVDAAMAKIMDRKPYTHEQLREARRLIEEEADRIRPRFKRAKGIKREKRKESLRGFLKNLIERVEINLVKV